MKKIRKLKILIELLVVTVALILLPPIEVLGKRLKRLFGASKMVLKSTALAGIQLKKSTGSLQVRAVTLRMTLKALPPVNVQIKKVARFLLAPVTALKSTSPRVLRVRAVTWTVALSLVFTPTLAFAGEYIDADGSSTGGEISEDYSSNSGGGTYSSDTGSGDNFEGSYGEPGTVNNEDDAAFPCDENYYYIYSDTYNNYSEYGSEHVENYELYEHEYKEEYEKEERRIHVQFMWGNNTIAVDSNTTRESINSLLLHDVTAINDEGIDLSHRIFIYQSDDIMQKFEYFANAKAELIHIREFDSVANTFIRHFDNFHSMVIYAVYYENMRFMSESRKIETLFSYTKTLMFTGMCQEYWDIVAARMVEQSRLEAEMIVFPAARGIMQLNTAPGRRGNVSQFTQEGDFFQISLQTHQRVQGYESVFYSHPFGAHNAQLATTNHTVARGGIYRVQIETPRGRPSRSFHSSMGTSANIGQNDGLHGLTGTFYIALAHGANFNTVGNAIEGVGIQNLIQLRGPHGHSAAYRQTSSTEIFNGGDGLFGGNGGHGTHASITGG